MRRDWDKRAEEDARFYIASGAAASDEEFLTSGEGELEEAVLDGIELDPGAEALEIGCGVGRLLIPLSSKVRAAHGVDISEVMIRKSAEYCASRPNVKTRVTDGTLRDFADASLDFVFSFIVFQHIPEKAPIRTYVEEAARVLAPGGLFRFQVDGRWGKERDPSATYDGVKFSPADVKELLAGTPLDVLEEWGAETHYHWVTARRRGAPAGQARFRPREYDPVVLVHMLEASGAADAPAAAHRVLSGQVSLRHALEPLQARLRGLDDESLVRVAYRGLLGAEPPKTVLEHHVHILSSGIEAQEDFLDILIFSSELRNLVRPFAPELPWYRLENLRETVPALSLEAPLFEAVEAGVRHLRGCPAERAVRLAFLLVLGRVADPDGAAFYERLFASHPLGRRLVVRHLLASPEAAARPTLLPDERRRALAARTGIELPPSSALTAGESFHGEAVIGRKLLAGSLWMGARDFVAHAYDRVLGRAADAEGLDFYAGRLESGSLGRAELLRELLWSAELRET
jgi:SAM-dependent methyltransferase